MSTNTKKKICYIAYKVYPGPNFDYLSKIVTDNGYDVTLITLLEDGQEPFKIIDGRKIHRISLPANHKIRKNSLAFISKTAELINKHNFSIVHIHSSCLYFGLLKMYVKNDAKFIYHSLSYPLSDSAIQRVKHMLIISVQSLFMDKFLFQSEEAKDHWIGTRLLRKIEIVPVGFDKNALYPVKDSQKRYVRNLLSISENQPVLVFSGAISKFRQLDQLIQAFAKVNEKLKDVKLIMIGDGNALRDLKAIAHSLQVEKNIIFTGQIPHDQLVNYIGMADIGISYIPINENYNYNPPLKTFEYLACGLPTIATKTISNCGIIKDGFNGVLVKDTPEDVSTSIINLIRDKKIQTLFKTNARKSISSFDFENITKNYLLPIYEDLLKF